MSSRRSLSSDDVSSFSSCSPGLSPVRSPRRFSSTSGGDSESAPPPSPTECGILASMGCESTGSVRKRAWVFTLNNYSCADITRFSTFVPEKCKFLCYGKELAPSTGTPHLQGFVFFNDAKTRSSVAKIFPRCFLAASKDDPTKGFASAIEYCKKSGEYTEFGVRPKSSKDKGLDSVELWDKLRDAAKIGDFDNIPSEYLIRYYATFKNLRKDYMVAPVDMPSVCGVWVQGVAGCGKSRYCRNLVENKFYRKMRNHWWDGYRNEDFVICDDIDVYDVKLGGLFKDWTDRYSFTAEAKGGAMSIRPKLVFFTSQYGISDIWKDNETVDALRRRCFVINMFDPQFVLPSNVVEILTSLSDRNILN